MSLSPTFVYDKSFTDFNVRYYVTKQPPCTNDEFDAVPEFYYGVSLVKTSGGVETESAGVLLTESEDEAMRLIKILYDNEVTPISLYEVIDQVVTIFD